MTSLVHHTPRLELTPTPSTGGDLVAVKAGAHPRIAVAIIGVLACLVAAAILTVAAIAGTDTHGRIPTPRRYQPPSAGPSRAADPTPCAPVASTQDGAGHGWLVFDR